MFFTECSRGWVRYYTTIIIMLIKQSRQTNMADFGQKHEELEIMALNYLLQLRLCTIWHGNKIIHLFYISP